MKGLSSGGFDVDGPSSSKKPTGAASAAPPPKMKGLSLGALDGPSPSESPTQPSPLPPSSGGPSVRPKMQFGVGLGVGNPGQSPAPMSNTPQASTSQPRASRQSEGSS
eukprot:scaffold247250_cov18-Tisochrysis_lutea.AAC.1